MTLDPATVPATASTSSKNYFAHLQVAPGGRAIIFIPSVDMLRQILKWRVSYEWEFDARGRPVGLRLRPARTGEPVLEVHQFATGCALILS